MINVAIPGLHAFIPQLCCLHASNRSVKEHNPENAEFRQPSTYVSFSFRYRSKAFLVSQGIMPEERKVAIRPILPRTPVRRIASAPVTPSGPISPQHPFTAPAAQYPPYATPNPSPDTKPKPLPKKTGYMRVVCTTRQARFVPLIQLLTGFSTYTKTIY